MGTRTKIQNHRAVRALVSFGWSIEGVEGERTVLRHPWSLSRRDSRRVVTAVLSGDTATVFALLRPLAEAAGRARAAWMAEEAEPKWRLTDGTELRLSQIDNRHLGNIVRWLKTNRPDDERLPVFERALSERTASL